MKTCFVISPIGEEGSDTRKQANETLEFVIRPACEEKGFDVVRSDTISDSGMITQSIVEYILQADLAIADLTGRNPNVFYELAIRHSHGLPAIQITRDDLAHLPFDVHNVRTIQYDLSASGARKASQEISKVIDSIESGSKTLNPVTSVSNILKLSDENAIGKDQVLSDLLLKVNSIPERLEQLENNIGVRFTQMLTAFGESIRMNVQSNQQQSDVQDVMLQKFFETLLDNPQKGMSQLDNLMAAQKMLEDKGFLKKNS